MELSIYPSHHSASGYRALLSLFIDGLLTRGSTFSGSGSKACTRGTAKDSSPKQSTWPGGIKDPDSGEDPNDHVLHRLLLLATMATVFSQIQPPFKRICKQSVYPRTLLLIMYHQSVKKTSYFKDLCRSLAQDYYLASRDRIPVLTRSPPREIPYSLLRFGCSLTGRTLLPGYSVASRPIRRQITSPLKPEIPFHCVSNTF